MKSRISTIALIFACLSLVSCNNSPNNTVEESANNPIPQSEPETVVSEVPSNPDQTSDQPQVATVTELVNGDLLCYATLVDEQGVEHQVGASFEICAEADRFLNQKVRATYTVESVSDCESIEPCGKTREESIITTMEVLS